MAIFTCTFEVEEPTLAAAREYCHTVYTQSAIVEPVVFESGTSLDLYLILSWDPEENFVSVVDTWTILDIDINPEGWEEAYTEATAKYSGCEIRRVVMPSRGLPEVFRIPRVGGGTVQPITE